MESKNRDIANFLENAKSNDYEKFEVLQKLRELVFEAFPNVQETFKYGGIMLSLNEEFGGLFLYKNHISFEFSYGYKLNSELKLEGGGKYRRHLKFRALLDIQVTALKDLLKQIELIDNGL